MNQRLMWVILLGTACFMRAQTGDLPPSPGVTGSLYVQGGRLSDLGRDLRASQLNDVVTIVVRDSASAVTRGTTNSKRASSATSSIGALLGPKGRAGQLLDLTSLGSNQQLQGQGETSRESTLTTTISARVVNVLPNGNMVVQGFKDISVNHERQVVTIRGLLRWNDVGAGNQVLSTRLANLEIQVNGKGVVGDSVRRPNFLYRLILGLLPF